MGQPGAWVSLAHGSAWRMGQPGAWVSPAHGSAWRMGQPGAWADSPAMPRGAAATPRAPAQRRGGSRPYFLPTALAARGVAARPPVRGRSQLGSGAGREPKHKGRKGRRSRAQRHSVEGREGEQERQEQAGGWGARCIPLSCNFIRRPAPPCSTTFAAGRHTGKEAKKEALEAPISNVLYKRGVGGPDSDVLAKSACTSLGLANSSQWQSAILICKFLPEAAESVHELYPFVLQKGQRARPFRAQGARHSVIGVPRRRMGRYRLRASVRKRRGSVQEHIPDFNEAGWAGLQIQLGDGGE
eukprot:gene14065-biopygen1019